MGKDELKGLETCRKHTISPLNLSFGEEFSVKNVLTAIAQEREFREPSCTDGRLASWIPLLCGSV